MSNNKKENTKEKKTENTKKNIKKPKKINQNFKQHPVFDKKKKRADSLSGSRQSKYDPILKTFEQHTAHKIRIVKITTTLAFLGFLSVLIAIFYSNMQAELQYKKVVNSYRNKLMLLDKKIENNSLYERERFAIQAIRLIEKLIKIDKEHRQGWIREQGKYIKIISLSFPVTKMKRGMNYVVSSAFIPMAHIPAGKFYMGSDITERGDKDEQPKRAILISNEYWISRTEVTNYQFKKLIPQHKVKPWGEFALNLPDYPVVRVSWHLAKMYCDILTKLEKEASRIPKGYEYRLPTEAEWEYVCRAGTKTAYIWGNEVDENAVQFANMMDKKSALFHKCYITKDLVKDDKFKVVAPVASFKPNSFGVYDMTGNVWEWCYDWYHKDIYKNMREKNPINLTPKEVTVSKKRPSDAVTYAIKTMAKVTRGGSWWNPPHECRSASRDYAPAEDSSSGTGFRIVLAPRIKYKD